MQITRQADYAVLAVLYLARLGPEGRASTAQIARAQQIPSSFLAKIVSQLASAGFVRATRGARGGVMLARSPEEITLLDVVETIDGPLALNECVADPEHCPLSQACAVREVWNEAQIKLVRQLAQTNFEALRRAEPTTVALN